MLFNTFEFIFFFIATVVVYYILNHKFRWLWLLLVSYYFYFAWEPKLVLLLFASTLLDYVCGIKIYNSKKSLTRKLYLIGSITLNLGMLIFFKYMGFFTDNYLQILKLFGADVPNADQLTTGYEFSRILIPIGISFYTFQTLSYSIEVYRKNIEAERHLGRYALYVSFFPQLIAGPIERAQKFLPQLKNKIVLNIESVRKGLMLMAWGYFMKMVVADRLGIYVDIVFKDPGSFSGIPLLVGAYFFTFQIYFDFAAYSIIAIGAAQVLGFSLMTNFNRPVFSKTASEFWNRWHISLMSWLRDYLYRPLVKSGKVKRYGALLIIFIVSGFWHGANWTFVLWGVLNGLFLLFEIVTRKFRKKVITRVFGFIPPVIFQLAWWIFSFHFLVISLIIFRSPTIPDALNYLQHIPNIHGASIYSVLKDNKELALSFFLVIVVQIVHYFKADNKVYELIIDKKPLFRWSVYMLFIVVIVFFTAVRNDPFIYFQF